MMKPFKKLLVEMARLPARDQRWILKQLPHTAQATLSRLGGLTLLKEAQRFRTLAPQDICLPKEPDIRLPVYAHTLAGRAPLYTAIVLEQGHYPWVVLFLNQFDTTGVIQGLLKNQALDLKPAVKQTVFKEWEDTLTFEQHLKTSHG